MFRTNTLLTVSGRRSQVETSNAADSWLSRSAAPSTAAKEGTSVLAAFRYCLALAHGRVRTRLCLRLSRAQARQKEREGRSSRSMEHGRSSRASSEQQIRPHRIFGGARKRQKHFTCMPRPDRASRGNAGRDGEIKRPKRTTQIGTIRSKSIIPDMPEAIPAFSNTAILRS